MVGAPTPGLVPAGRRSGQGDAPGRWRGRRQWARQRPADRPAARAASPAPVEWAVRRPELPIRRTGRWAAAGRLARRPEPGREPRCRAAGDCRGEPPERWAAGPGHGRMLRAANPTASPAGRPARPGDRVGAAPERRPAGQVG